MRRLLFILLILQSSFCISDSVPFSDYKFLNEGMSEGEVLYRIGEPDHETIEGGDLHRFIFRKTWFYIPEKEESRSTRWITEVTFNSRGNVINLQRYRP